MVNKFCGGEGVDNRRCRIHRVHALLEYKKCNDGTAKQLISVQRPNDEQTSSPGKRIGNGADG